MMENNEVTIEQMNEAIAILMGLTPRLVQPPDPALHGIEVWYKNESVPMQYHVSWDWLMPAWAKAANILFQIRAELSHDKYIEAHVITKSFIGACQVVNIDRAHLAVYNATKLITWYNDQQK